MYLIPAFGRQRQEDLCGFEVSQLCIASSRAAKAIQRDPNEVVGRRKRL